MPPAAVRPPRNMRPIIAAAVIVALGLVAVIGYAVAGYAFSSSRLDSARNTYNAIASHQNAITVEFNSINSRVTAVKFVTSGLADYKKNRAAFDLLVSQSQAAQATFSSDDNSLVAAQASLSDNSWLTVFNRSSLDRASAKIGHWRKALASAKTITEDLVQLGTFFQAYDDSLIDLDTMAAKAKANDFLAMMSAISALKTDVAKAIQLSSAPGVPPDMKQLLTDLQTFAVDLLNLVNDALARNTSAVQADASQIKADGTTVDSYDFVTINTEIVSFYQPLVDAYNSEVFKANST